MTGGRLKRIKGYVNNETFFMTYGDGLADVNLDKLLNHHMEKKKLATVTGTVPPGRFGALKTVNDSVVGFQEKPEGDSIINGGFFVLEPSIFDFIEGDKTLWEKEPLENLAKNDQLTVFKHEGFWQPMDTLREKNLLEDLWASEKAPWKTW